MAAQAYIDDTELGDAEATAGEQHSNLYKLNVRGDLVIKRLKKLDDYVARSEASGKGVSASDFEDLLISEKEDRVKQDVKKVLADVTKKTADPKKLKVVTDSNLYLNIHQLRDNTIKDRSVAQSLRKVLQQGRRL